VSLGDIVDAMNGESVLLGGRIPQNTVVRAQAKGIKVYDYFASEKLQIKNAYITAEAAVSIAMNSLEKCIRDSRVCITGTGRISRLLASMLVKLGAEVTVAARNADNLVYFELMGCKTVQTVGKWYDEFLKGYDVIFNTVPAWLFDRAFLEAADKSMLIIELASAPGGLDICAARELSSNVRWASSLPGKYAPYSAGALIAECIIETLCSEEVKLL
jgi:dipicolinate synthase subunit A